MKAARIVFSRFRGSCHGITNSDGAEYIARCDVERELEARDARIAELEAALREVTDNLEDCINADYPEYKLKYQSYVLKRNGEMDIVNRARRALEGKTP